MPLRTNFSTVYTDGESITERVSKTTIPGTSINTLERQIDVGTKLVYPATTQETALRECLIISGNQSALNYFLEVPEQNAYTPSGNQKFFPAHIVKSINANATSQDRRTQGWESRVDISVSASILSSNKCTLTASQAFTNSLVITASRVSPMPSGRPGYLLLMPIRTYDQGIYLANNSGTVSTTITFSCLVVSVFIAGTVTGASDTFQSNWGIYHKRS